ncbi:MAG TPA: symmetrical bis(5'-nucleosyl)-tetraphosphatase [Chromatiales bacterium]|nr:symmetrical bis(5'-nucleosyl)-tetraphosphatase [Chromatiales bacterium]
MAIYAIGDIQGCYEPLQRLLKKINFRPKKDQLWFVGDLVNRGPQSLETLRFIKSLGKNAVTVLGNHDLHLLAMAANSTAKKHKSLLPILEAPDCDELIDWLLHRPLLHYDKKLDTALVHAGIPPGWKIKTALKRAHEVETILQQGDYKEFLKIMYGNKPDLWSKALQGNERLRFIVNAYTRMRYCDIEGRLDYDHKLAPGTQPQGLYPWFRLPRKRSFSTRIIFGHWSTLGYMQEKNFIALDTGCVWKGKLTAVRLDSKKPEAVSVKCQ